MLLKLMPTTLFEISLRMKNMLECMILETIDDDNTIRPHLFSIVAKENMV